MLDLESSSRIIVPNSTGDLSPLFDTVSADNRTTLLWRREVLVGSRDFIR